MLNFRPYRSEMGQTILKGGKVKIIDDQYERKIRKIKNYDDY